MPRTSFTDLVGCRLPLQQAPMGAISPPALARAVAAAGGLGTLPVPFGGDVPADLAEQTNLPGGVFAINLTGEGVGLGTIGRAAAFAVCPLCATRPTARVLSSAVAAVRGLPDERVGVLSTPNGEVVLSRGHGMPPTRSVSGTVAAMALYAGEAVGAVTEVRPAGEVVAAMCRDADALLTGAVPQPRDPGGRER